MTAGVSRTLLLAVLAAWGCSRRAKPPPPASPPAPAPSPSVSQHDVAPSLPVDLSPTIKPEMLRPPALPARQAGSAPLRPAAGLVLARGWRRPSIAVGTSGAIVVFGQGSAAKPPAFAARSECEWREAATVLPWAAFDGPPPAPPADTPCDRHRPAYRKRLVLDAWEPAVVECDGARGVRCRIRSLASPAHPDLALPARLGVPTLAKFDGLPYEQVSGALVAGRSLVWVSTALHAPVVLARSLPFSCAAASCSITLWPETVGMTVQLLHNDGRRLDVAVSPDGHAGKPQIKRVKVGHGSHTIDAERRLVRRYGLTTRDLDVPVGGVGAPVLDYAIATGSEGPFVAWIEGDPPAARLRLAQMNMVLTDISGTPLELAGPGELGEVALASVSRHTAVAWTEREGDTWVVKAAEVVAVRP